MKLEENKKPFLYPAVTTTFLFSSYLETPLNDCNPKRQQMSQKSPAANTVDQAFFDAVNIGKNELSKFIKLQYSIKKRSNR